MGDMLQRMLNEVVVTPYDAKITSQLATVCDAMAEEVSVYNIDRYIQSFVFNKPDWELKKEVEEKYAEMFPEEEKLILPPLFAIVLAQNMTFDAVTNKMVGQDRAVASLILMNYMLYRKGSLTRLILPNHIAEMFFKLDDFIFEKDTIGKGDELKSIGNILSTPDYLIEHYNQDEVRKEVREMAKMATLYKRQAIIEKYRKQRTKSLYVKVYEYLSEVIEQTNWLFMKNDVKQLLTEIISEEEQKKQATIEGIVNELMKVGVKLPYETLEESSLLLKYIKKGPIPVELKNKRLTVMEFGVYVYYEILLEHIIGEYYGS